VPDTAFEIHVVPIRIAKEYDAGEFTPEESLCCIKTVQEPSMDGRVHGNKSNADRFCYGCESGQVVDEWNL
jgi:hypothetical protein